jgi:hypothetical protein
MSRATIALVCLIALGGGSAAQTGVNLIVNPGAEAGAAAPTGYEVVPIPGWISSGPVTAVPWSLSSFMPSGSAGPADRGLNFFAGGFNAPASTATQTVSVASFAAAIDAGGFPYVLSGWFGGYSTQDDQAKLTATFRNAGGASLGTSSVGPVLAADRGNISGIRFRTTNGTLPPGTRSVDCVLAFLRLAGTYDDGYADNVSFVIGSYATVGNLGGACGAGAPTPTLTASVPALGQPFNVAVNATPNRPGQVVMSAPASPIAIGSCTVFVNVASYVPLFNFTTSAYGAWSASITLPSDPGFAGTQVVLQAYASPTVGPLGLDVTNALLMIVAF